MFLFECFCFIDIEQNDRRNVDDSKKKNSIKEHCDILEELLKETHGCNWYHWSCNEL